MQIAKDKVVKINYTLTDDEGKQIDTSVGGEPLQYVHGNGYLLSKLEEALEGKTVGDKITTVIAAKDGYGEYDEKLIVEVPREQFDTSVQIEPGMQFQADTPVGPQIVTVMKVTDTSVTINGNHELAGKNLHFDVEVMEVRDATEEELKQVSGGCGCGCEGGCDCENDDECGGNCSGNCDGCHNE
jgi:FKBP-type peptidyl-prolyl cis-trans isomerase SlyD